MNMNYVMFEYCFYDNCRDCTFIFSMKINFFLLLFCKKNIPSKRMKKNQVACFVNVLFEKKLFISVKTLWIFFFENMTAKSELFL